MKGVKDVSKSIKEQLLQLLKPANNKKEIYDVDPKTDSDNPYDPNGSWKSDSGLRRKASFKSIWGSKKEFARQPRKLSSPADNQNPNKDKFIQQSTATKPESPKFVERKASPSFRPRINRDLLLKMPDWAAKGISIQHPETKVKNARPLTVRIGLDFGTAFTKVAINVKEIAVICVDWGPVIVGETNQTHFVLPGMVGYNQNGAYSWSGSYSEDIKSNLKLPIMENTGTNVCPFAAIAFLSFVIRYSRAFLYQDKNIGRSLIDRSLQWELNIGCPTEQNKDQEIVKRFDYLVRAAWELAGERIDPTDPYIHSVWKRVCGEGWNPGTVGLASSPSVVPEFVAQIAGYIGSGQASDTTYALIDIGTATLDVAVFNIVMNSEEYGSPKIPIFFSAVRNLGSHFLNNHRHAALSLDLEWDDSKLVEDSVSFAARHGLNAAEVRNVDEVFIKEIAKKICHIIDSTRTSLYGDPRSRVWLDGLPVFITGGGSASPVFLEAINIAEAELKSRISMVNSSNRFRIIKIDLNGKGYKGLGSNDSLRLTVALGLTEDSDDIERIFDVPKSAYNVVQMPDHAEFYED